MSPSKRYARKHAQARQRRRLQATERLERDRRQAQRVAEALHQALEALGLPSPPGGGDRRALMEPTAAPGHNGRRDVPAALWVPDAFGALSCAWLGHAGARTAAGSPAQALLAQAAAAPGGGGARAPLASCARQKPSHAEPLAVALGLGRFGGPQVGGAGALGRQVVERPAPLGVADSWCDDSTLRQQVREAHQGTWLVEGKASYGFPLADGRPVKGHDLLEGKGWRGQQPPWEAGVHYVRRRATRPTSGQVPVGIVDAPGQDRFYLLGLETEWSAPQLIRRWRRRSGIECVCRPLKHLLATESCQGHSADAYYGHLVVRVLGCFVLFYTARVICKGRLTLEESLCSLQHYWRFVELEALKLQGLSWGVEPDAA